MNQWLKKVSIYLATFSFFTLLPLPSAMAVDLRTIDVVAVSWPGAQAPAVTVQDVARAVEVEVAPRWREFTSVQQVPNDKTLTFQLGIVETRRIDLTAKMSCESLTFGTFITNIRDAFYSSLAIVDSK